MSVLGLHYIDGQRRGAGEPLFSVDAITGERHAVRYHDATPE